tara:strand:- start:3368 stop:3526 length:159 start_codon:yes stop_codon:yes gene_type:complete
MEDLYIIPIILLAVLVLTVENKYPEIMKTISKKIKTGLKNYWKALKEWESGN